MLKGQRAFSSSRLPLQRTAVNLRKITKPPAGDELRLFHEVARALTSNLELEPLLRAILGKMEEYFGPERWSFADGG